MQVASRMCGFTWADRYGSYSAAEPCLDKKVVTFVLNRSIAMATERVYAEPPSARPTGAAAALSGGTREQTAAEEDDSLPLAYTSSLTNLDKISKVSSQLARRCS